MPVRSAASRAPAHTAAMPSSSGQAPEDVQERAPADLDIADVVGRLGLDQLGADAVQGLGVLHERDGQVEGLEQLGLGGARHRRDERSRHAQPVAGRIDAAGPCQLQGRIDPQRAVEVQVQLGLGHRLDEAAAGGGVGIGARERSCADATIPRSPLFGAFVDRIRAAGRTERESDGRHPGGPEQAGPTPCPRSSSPAPAASSAARPSPRSSMPAIASSPWCARPPRARSSCGRLSAEQRAAVELRTGDVTRPESLPAALAGVDAVVHLVAIPRDLRGGADLRLVNTEGTRAVVVAMQAAGVRRLVHMGAMGVQDDPALHYASSKAKAEALVRDSGLDWTILKPSLQFGPGRRVLQHHRRPGPDVAGHRPGPGRWALALPAHPRRRCRARGRPRGRRSGHGRAARTSWVARATGRTARSPRRS